MQENIVRQVRLVISSSYAEPFGGSSTLSKNKKNYVKISALGGVYPIDIFSVPGRKLGALSAKHAGC